MTATSTYTPHPLVAEISEQLLAQGLAPLPQSMNYGAGQTVLLDTSITEQQARLAINWELRRRLNKIEERTGANFIQERTFLQDEFMEGLWKGQLLMDIIPILKQHQQHQ